MADPDFLFHKNDLFNVAICKICQYGVISSRIAHHILDKHENETEESAKHIAEIVSNWNVRNDRNITYSNNAIDQQEHLPLYKGAFKCNNCNYFSRHVYNMRAHCQHQHNWNPYETENGKPRKIGPWREQVYCQMIFSKGFLSCYFEVKADAINDDLVQQAAMDPDFLFHKNDFFNVAICKKCQYGVLAGDIRDHIIDHHKDESELSAINIAHIVSTWNVRDTTRLKYPEEIIDQQHHLKLRRNGFACEECGIIIKSRSGMKRHCLVLHKWIAPFDSKTAQRMTYSEIRMRTPLPWRENVPFQQIFSHFQSPLFEVRLNHMNAESSQLSSQESNYDWLRKVRWPDVFASLEGKNLEARELKPDDDLTQKIWDSTISTLTKAYQLGIYLRENSLLLNSNEIEDQFVAEEHTFEQLATYFASLMLFFARTTIASEEQPFTFTPRQLADWNNYRKLAENYQQEIQQGCKDELSGTEEACTRFCISLFDQEVYSELESPLIIAMGYYVALCNGLEQPRRRMLAPLLGWIKCARWMLTNFVSLPIETIRNVYPDIPNKIKHPSDLLEHFNKHFLSVTSHKPMAWLLGHLEDTGAMVSRFGSKVMIDLKLYSRTNLSRMLRGYTSETREFFLTKILRSSKPPAIYWNTLADTVSERKQGYNFTLDPRNRHMQQGIERFNVDLRKVEEFREMLLLLVYITSGTVARSAEFLKVRHSNTEGELRNVFIDDGMVLIKSSYYNVCERLRSTEMYLPEPVGELVVGYMSLVLPFDKSCSESRYQLWPNVTEARFSQLLENVTKKYLTEPLGVAELSLVNEAIGRQYGLKCGSSREFAKRYHALMFRTRRRISKLV